MENLRVDTETTENLLILRLAGRLTLDQAQAFRQGLDRAWREDARSILVELSDSSYLDCAGAALLLRALQRARREGKEFCLVGLGAQAQSVLQMTKLDRIFSCPHPAPGARPRAICAGIATTCREI